MAVQGTLVSRMASYGPILHSWLAIRYRFAHDPTNVDNWAHVWVSVNMWVGVSLFWQGPVDKHCLYWMVFLLMNAFKYKLSLLKITSTQCYLKISHISYILRSTSQPEINSYTFSAVLSYTSEPFNVPNFKRFVALSPFVIRLWLVISCPNSPKFAAISLNGSLPLIEAISGLRLALNMRFMGLWTKTRATISSICINMRSFR